MTRFEALKKLKRVDLFVDMVLVMVREHKIKEDLIAHLNMKITDEQSNLIENQINR